jgi:ABC-type branched-subunit amino acid transport system permease subunit
MSDDQSGNRDDPDQSAEETDESTSERGRVRRLLETSDLALIVGVMLVLYVIFTIFSLALGLGVTGTIRTLERITFFAAVYALVVLALNLQWGYAGLFNIGIAGFMAVSMYTMATIVVRFGQPYPVGVLGGVVAAGLFGAVVALPALRLRADYLAIVTLAFAEIARRIFGSQRFSEFSFLGLDLGFWGATGPNQAIPDPLKFLLYKDPYSLRPEPNAFGEFYFGLFEPFVIEDSTAEGLLYVAMLVVFVLLFYMLASRIGNSPFGRVLKAIREDETVARALGKDTRRFKVIIFTVGSALMGLAAILWFLRRGGVSPTVFEPEITFFIFVALIIGGAGSNTGSVIGGAVFGALLFQGPAFVERIARQRNIDAQPATIFDAFGGVEPFLAYTIDNMSALRVVLLGVVLIVLIQRRPQGLLGDRKEIASGIDLHERSDGGESE